MISIWADSNWIPMAKVQHHGVSASWGQVGTVVVTILGAFSLLIGVIYSGVQDRLLSIDTSVTRIELGNKSHGESLARIEEKFKYLDHRVELLEKPHYESKAKASGFKNPKVIPASLTAQEKFESRPIDSGNEQYFTRYTILSYAPKDELLTVRVDTIIRGSDGRERFGNNHDNLIAFRVKSGEKAIVPPMFAERPHPTIFIEVLERTSPSRAILAIGEKIKPGDESS